MKKLTLFLILAISTMVTIAQKATVIDPNAVTVPRFASQAAVNTAIPSPNQGMFIYRNDTQSFWYYTSAGWSNLAAAVSGAWSTTGANISNTNSGNVGIGVTNPSHPLETKGRIRIRDSGGGESAGLWFNNIGNTDLNTFVGIDPGNKFGIYSPILSKNIFTADMATGGIRLDGPAIPNSGFNTLSLGGYGNVSIDAAGILGGRLTILENGNTGLGITNPSRKFEIDGSQTIHNGFLRFQNAITGSNFIGSSLGYLRLNGGDALNGNGVWINNQASNFGGIKIGVNYDLDINGDAGQTGNVLTSTGAGGTIAWKSLRSIIQNLTIVAPEFTPPNNLLNQLPSSSITFTALRPGTLVIHPGVKTTYACINPLDHCHISADFQVQVNGNRLSTEGLTPDTFQDVFAYLAFGNNRSLGPYFINVSAGTHTITFHYKLNTITPAPAINLRVFAQFTPN